MNQSIFKEFSKLPVVILNRMRGVCYRSEQWVCHPQDSLEWGRSLKGGEDAQISEKSEKHTYRYIKTLFERLGRIKESAINEIMTVTSWS